MSHWTPDIESILERIRLNSVTLSNHHRGEYIQLRSYLKYFRFPVIVLSAVAAVSNVALGTYINQNDVALLCASMSLITGLVSSCEAYLQIQKRMETELVTSKEHYLNGIDIFKTLSLSPDHRNGDGVQYLEERFNIYKNLFESSNVHRRKVVDALVGIDVVTGSSIISSLTDII